MITLLDKITKKETNKIGKLCEDIFSGGTPTTTNRSYWNGDINWLSSGETRNDFINNTEKKITKEGVDNSSTRLAKKGDVVIATAGQGFTRGQVSMLNVDTYINQSLIALSVDKKKLNPQYLFYNLKKRYWELRSLSDATSSRGSITCTLLSGLDINTPDLETQEKIAEILSSYDKKIENNNKIIETLEKIAETIFKEWFVDFRFPDHKNVNLIEIEGGELPENWEMGKIIDFGEVVCGKTPSKKKSEYFGGDIPFIKIPDMHGQIFVNKTIDTLSTEGALTQENKFIPKNSVCVSCIATVGLVSITTKDSQTNQQINSIVPDKDYYLPYLYIALKRLKSRLQAIGSGGSTTLNVNTGAFSNIFLVKPEERTLEDFNILVRPMFTKIQGLLEENQKLSQTRDLLLNKLI